MNDLSISNNVRDNIKRILNENRSLKQKDFADAIDMDKSQFHRMLNTPMAIDVDYVVKWMKWLGVDPAEDASLQNAPEGLQFRGRENWRSVCGR